MRSELLCAWALMGISAAAAQATVVYLQDVEGNDGFTFNGQPVTQATFDDTYVQTGGSGLDVNFGAAASYQLRTTSGGLVNYALIAVKDLFTLVPAGSGGNPIQINSATLYLASSGSNQPAGYILNVRRITADWLANPAGDNEGRASGNQRNAPTAATSSGATISGGTAWPGGSGSFGSGSYTATNALLNAPFANSTYGAYIGLDVTGMVNDMYALGENYGFSVSTPYVQNDFVNIRSSEDTLLVATHETFRPVLAIDYEYVPEPGAAGLLAAALGGVLIRRRAGRVTAG